MSIKLKDDTLEIGNDSLFKSMFRSEKCRPMVAAVLNRITGIEEEKILKANFIGGEIPKKQKDEKGKSSDILIEIDDNTVIIVEMNKIYYKTLFQKNASYAFSTYCRRTHIKDKFYPNVHLVNIDNFSHFEGNNPVVHMMIQDKQDNIDIFNYHSYHFDIEKAAIMNYNGVDEVLIRFGKFMNVKSLKDLRKIAKGDERFMFAFDEINSYVGDDARVVTYDREKLHEWEKEQFKNDGREEGIEQKTKETVTAMSQKGFNLRTISEVVNISIDEVKTILNQ